MAFNFFLYSKVLSIFMITFAIQKFYILKISIFSLFFVFDVISKNSVPSSFMPVIFFNVLFSVCILPVYVYLMHIVAMEARRGHQIPWN